MVGTIGEVEGESKMKYLVFLLFIIAACGAHINNEVWKQNPYNDKCLLIETNYNNYILHLPAQFPQTYCNFVYYYDYEDGYSYCKDTNEKTWFYFKTLEECVANGGISE